MRMMRFRILPILAILVFFSYKLQALETAPSFICEPAQLKAELQSLDKTCTAQSVARGGPRSHQLSQNFQSIDPPNRRAIYNQIQAMPKIFKPLEAFCLWEPESDIGPTTSAREKIPMSERRRTIGPRSQGGGRLVGVRHRTVSTTHETENLEQSCSQVINEFENNLAAQKNSWEQIQGNLKGQLEQKCKERVSEHIAKFVFIKQELEELKKKCPHYQSAQESLLEELEESIPPTRNSPFREPTPEQRAAALAENIEVAQELNANESNPEVARVTENIMQDDRAVELNAIAVANSGDSSVTGFDPLQTSSELLRREGLEQAHNRELSRVEQEKIAGALALQQRPVYTNRLASANSDEARETLARALNVASENNAIRSSSDRAIQSIDAAAEIHNRNETSPERVAAMEQQISSWKQEIQNSAEAYRAWNSRVFFLEESLKAVDEDIQSLGFWSSTYNRWSDHSLHQRKKNMQAEYNRLQQQGRPPLLTLPTQVQNIILNPDMPSSQQATALIAIMDSQQIDIPQR
jgi:hypothetical protein